MTDRKQLFLLKLIFRYTLAIPKQNPDCGLIIIWITPKTFVHFPQSGPSSKAYERKRKTETRTIHARRK